MNISDNTINTFHQDKWKINFSNIPSLDNTFKDLNLYDLYVKSVTLPDVNMTETFEHFKTFIVRHPVIDANQNLSQLQVTFKVDEQLKNYYNMYNFLMNLKNGKKVTNDLIRLNTIDSIDIIILDNQKRNNTILSFKNCFLLSLSSLSLVYGDSTNVDFTCNFSYESNNINNNVNNA